MEKNKLRTKILKKPDDSLALRASIGGRTDIGKVAFYCVYRGNLPDIIEMLEIVIKDLKNSTKEE